MTQYKLTSFLALMAAFAVHAAGIQRTTAAPPDVRFANMDFEGSGYVTPAGMAPPSQYAGNVMPVGLLQACDSGCDTPGCDGMSCSSGGCSTSSCDSSGSGLFDGSGLGGRGHGCLGGGCVCGLLKGGLLGKIRGCGCGNGGMRHLCFFCRGSGCSACQLLGGMGAGGLVLGALNNLRPYTEGGLCAQRWYDVSLEGLFLGRTTSGLGNVNAITQRGSGNTGTTVISVGDVFDSGLESGVRVSGALIFGAGGNVELTYMGGQEWSGRAAAFAPANLINNPNFGNPALAITDPLRTNPFIIDSGADLFSFISNFGTTPLGGFDDTDRSISQVVTSESDFHSGEVNYRRRTMGPYCRFQGSWLAGLRYLRYDNQLGLNIVGLNNDGTDASLTDGTLRFFSASDSVKNEMFGFQLGGDLWWNMTPGVSLGVELKGAWLRNEVQNDYRISANSIIAGAPGNVAGSIEESDGTAALEFQTKLAYRLSRSWTFRSAYYMIAIDEVGTPGFDADFITSVVQPLGGGITPPPIRYNSVIMNGFSFGAEYLW